MGFGFFIPQIALAVGKKKKMVSQHEILQWILCKGFHGLGLLHRISTSFSILVTSQRMFYHNFILHFSSYLPLTKPDLRCLYSCSYTNTRTEWRTDHRS
jgi:hypothetical protein